ncbi:MAG: UDP-N-acetylglucosamine--N-acetylmuramyl-(pentapeptide) pyrophosphoryl-undecaprenol N-acetylglucosamine transferase [Candidatus Parcubacteria bacterium]|nr:UDP-N-acetylglucosamine--N-acetylmuramyl-(pentapeptide) pyrophosphoryl-undecaprenol N-acetylglucosamine transferase [Candidatus Parcubacteria bacterium]
MLHLKNKEIRIIFTAGGSGGHTFPLIAIYQEMVKLAKEKNLDLKTLYLGPNDFTNRFINQAGLNSKNILTGKLRRSFNPLDILKNFGDFFKMIVGIFQSLWHLFFFMPDFIISKGGHGSLPVMLAANLYLIPKAIHESDSIPGLANIITSKISQKIFVSFKNTASFFPAKKTLLVGNPIRSDLLTQMDKKQAKDLLGLGEKPIILILGGSQGAQTINDIILDILPDLIENAYVIHQTGQNNFVSVSQEAKIIFQEIIKNDALTHDYRIIPFLEDTIQEPNKSLKINLWAADIIVSRAGSGAIFELAALGKPSILIPLPWASQDHQTKNAYEYSQNGAALIIESNNLTQHILSELILNTISDEKKLKEMSEAALAFAKPDAAKQISQEILNMIL